MSLEHSINSPESEKNYPLLPSAYAKRKRKINGKFLFTLFVPHFPVKFLCNSLYFTCTELVKNNTPQSTVWQ